MKFEPLDIIRAVAHQYDFGNPHLKREDAKLEVAAISAYLLKKHLSLSFKEIGSLLSCSWKEAQEHARSISTNKAYRLKSRSVESFLDSKHGRSDDYDFTFPTRDNKRVKVRVSIS